MLIAGVCKLCGTHTGFVENKATLKISRAITCPHCDSVCPNALCKKCARMRHTTRIVDRPEGEQEAT